MTAPSSDQAAIRQTLRALKAANITPYYVGYGEDEGEDVTGATEQATVKAIMAVDDAYLWVNLPGGSVRETSHIRFVMGNEPFEVICDYGLSLSPVLDPLTEGWDED